MSQYVVFGAGKMGEAIAYNLLRSRFEVLIVDSIDRKADDLAKKLNERRVSGLTLDVTDDNKVRELLRNYDVAINATSYKNNVRLTQLAIEAGAHFCDLGGNDDIVKEQFSLDYGAKRNGVIVIPACGIAPGAVNIITALGMQQLDTTEYVRIRVGGLPQNPQGQLGYMLLFSVEGLLNEYLQPTEIIREGKIASVESMTGIEKIVFPEFGTLEAAFTSGNLSTLPRTLESKVRNLDYKTLRWPGHWNIMNELRRLGFFSDSITTTRNGEFYSFRQFIEQMLETYLSQFKGPDVLLLRVIVSGKKEGRNVEITYTLVDKQNEETGHTAMQRTTGYTTSIIAQMLANGQIKGENGVLTLEESVDGKAFVDEWRKRDIILEEEIREI